MSSSGMLTVDGHVISLDPSVLEVSYQDISASDAGRVHDDGNTMYKMRTSQKVKIKLSWANPTAAQAAEILTAFDPEYFDVTYPDPKSNAMVTRTFYAGDRKAPMRWYALPGKGTRWGILTFDIIER